MKEEAIKVLLMYIDNSKEANDALSELLVIFKVSCSLPEDFKRWRGKNYYKNCNSMWVKIGHNNEKPVEHTNEQLKTIWRQ